MARHRTHRAADDRAFGAHALGRHLQAHDGADQAAHYRTFVRRRPLLGGADVARAVGPRLRGGQIGPRQGRGRDGGGGDDCENGSHDVSGAGAMKWPRLYCHSQLLDRVE